MQMMVAFHFDSAFSQDRLQTVMTRTFIQAGLPLEGYMDQNDRPFEQTEAQADWFLTMSGDERQNLWRCAENRFKGHKQYSGQVKTVA